MAEADILILVGAQFVVSWVEDAKSIQMQTASPSMITFDVDRLRAQTQTGVVQDSISSDAVDVSVS